MGKIYKLTDNKLRTHGGMQWTLGEWREDDQLGPMCGPGGFHGYSSPRLAVLLNPIHANYQPAKLFEAEYRGRGKANFASDGLKLKLKVRAMRITRQIELPEFSLTQRIYFGILCALEIPGQPIEFTQWANRWIEGKDRSAEAAAWAAWAAWAAAEAEAAARAARAAEAAARAARAARAAAWAAEAAAAAARAAAAWAAWAARADNKIDLDALAIKALAWIDPVC
jgi:hypothetical protein